MASTCSLDFETRSTLDLKKVGSYKYFEHETTDVLCLAYAFDDEEPELWLPGRKASQRLKDFITSTDKPLCAWNSSFERLAWREIMVKRYGAPPIDDSRWRCTMTEALSMNLPAKLEHCAPALGLNIVKDDVGHRVMMTLCKPRHTKDGSIKWWDDPARYERLYSYCRQDVRVEQAIAKRLFRLIPSEQKLYQLDMQINDRGVFIDKELCQAAQYVVQTASERLDKEMYAVSKGEIGACTNVQQIIKFLAAHGIVTESIDKENIEDLLIRDGLPENVRRVLELRQEGSKTSTAKIKSMLQRRQEDGRMRGNLQFYGASSTGRWAARGAQLQNLPRPQILNSTNAVEPAVQTLLTGDAELVELCYGTPLTVVSDCVRSMICAAPGHTLFACDFSNIEGRAVAWLANETDKLKAFRDLDNGVGEDIYLLAASAIYGVPPKDAKPFRQVGKVSELSCGYGGSAGAFAKMSKGYGLKLASLYDGIWERADDSTRQRAIKAWEHPRSKLTGLSERAFIAAMLIVYAWRDKNSKIAAYWRLCEDAAYKALENPGEAFWLGNVAFKKSGSFLFALLPSGRCLSYPYAKVAWIIDEESKKPKRVITHKSVNQFTKKWDERHIWGGLITENLTQAIARDIMSEAMLRTDKAGYKNVLTVHDEVVAEVPLGFGSLEEYEKLICEIPAWAEGFPITASGWTGYRYRKA